MLVSDPAPPSQSRAQRHDPRPLLGEPLALDLLNTQWIKDGQLQDLLATAEGVRMWLASAAVDPDLAPAHEAPVCHPLQYARSVIQDVAEHPESGQARVAFNALLARGHRERRLTPGGPTTQIVVDDPAWIVPWLAAENYLNLLARAPDRIRRCQHPECVLWYFDASRSGTRRWCSMRICGNRAKATRHYQRRSTE